MPASEVELLLDERDHPRRDVIDALRSILLGVSDVVESVKWNAPNYALDDDFATMQLRRDDTVQLVLHTGAKPKPEHPTIEISPLLANAKWASPNRLVLTLREMPTDADADVIASWVDQLV